MPVCTNCAADVRAGQDLCPNCGQALGSASVAQRPSAGSDILGVAIGLVVGVPASLFLNVIIATLLGVFSLWLRRTYNVTTYRQHELSPVAVAYIALDIAAVVAVVFLVARWRKMQPLLRGILVGVTVVCLGAFSFCTILYAQSTY